MAKFDIDSDLVRKLADLLAETDLSEIEYTQGDQRIRVARGGGGVIAAAAIAGADDAQSDPPLDDAHPGAVIAPMVGTVYLTPEPNAAPFVQVGDEVTEGQTLLIIEAMKVMNPIRAPRGGAIARILVDTGTPVEFGEPLMIIE